ncbi:MCP four helix bundle domain-containing protein, partial [Xylophilus sp. ASV27]|uniref:MCP four helix bundle domain-containing protein n=2 Tax=Xylophilus sp. ASV27 TaxID=2795129 RepID=UPI0018ED093F
MSFFENMRVARKVWGAFVLLLAAMLAIAALTYWQTQARNADAARYDLIAQALQWRGLTEVSITKTMAGALSADPTVADLFKEEQAHAAAAMQNLREKLGASEDTETGRAQLARIDELAAKLKEGTGVLLAAAEDGDGAVVVGKLQGTYRPAALAYLAAIEDYVRIRQERSETVAAEAAAAGRRLAIAGGAGALVLVLLGMAVAALLVRSIRDPLARSVDLAHAISAGDLTQQIVSTRRDEFGELQRALGQMNAFL